MTIPPFINFWKNWDADERRTASIVAGAAVAAFCVFFLVSVLSYLVHWQQDMSALGNVGMDEVSNKAGTLGLRFGHFLVADCFGLGSFALLLVFVPLCIRLFSLKPRFSLLKATLLAVVGAFVFSFVLAYADLLLGGGSAFGGGLGGECGAVVVKWITDLTGAIVGGCIIAVFILLWLVLAGLRWRARTIEEEFSGWENEDSVGPAVESVADEGPDSAEVVDVAADVPEVIEVEQEKTGEDAVDEGGLEIVRDEEFGKVSSEPLKRIDNRLDPPDGLPSFKFPELSLLGDYKSSIQKVSNQELAENNNKIRSALADYRIQVSDVVAVVGPTVTLYKVYPAAGVKIAEIKRLQDDIALKLNARGVRVVTLSDSVGIEVANEFSSTVSLKSLLSSDAFAQSRYELPVALGYTITQDVRVIDLSDAPHLLIAGATKQGKSVGLNVIVSSLLYSKHPSELKFVFIDPKMVEFSAYSSLLKHYLAVLPEADSEDDEKERAIVKTPKDAEKTLRSLCVEMDERYALMSKAGVNKVTLYNDRYRDHKLNPEHGHKFLPYLVVVVDEYADLTMMVGGTAETRSASKSITGSIIRLAQKGRAAGIHVILATQRPSVDVISGVIKSNFPMRIAFRVASRVDSMTILDSPGAEKLIGRGDMLLSAGIESERIQCGFVSGEEVESITMSIGRQQGYGKSYSTPYYLPVPPDGDGGSSGGGAGDMSDIDDRFVEAARLVVSTQKASTSFLQTRLSMGFAKSSRVMAQLETAGIVGAQEGAKPRQVLVSDLDSLEAILGSLTK